MRLFDFVGSQMPDAKQLPKMLRNGRVGASLRELEVAPVDSRELRRLVRLYANGPEGPFGKKRVELYGEVRELFHLLAGETGSCSSPHMGGSRRRSLPITSSGAPRTRWVIAGRSCVMGFGLGACVFRRTLGTGEASSRRCTPYRFHSTSPRCMCFLTHSRAKKVQARDMTRIGSYAKGSLAWFTPN